MENLRNDLFVDPKLETKTKRTAGNPAQIGPCGTALVGGTICLTCNGTDRLLDAGF